MLGGVAFSTCVPAGVPAIPNVGREELMPRKILIGFLIALAGSALFVVVVGAIAVFTRVDRGTTSRNVAATLARDPDYPYVGFWKRDCSQDFGTVLERADGGEYLNRFCGPGGCTAKTAASRTRLDGQALRPTGADTLEQHLIDEVITLHRCG